MPTRHACGFDLAHTRDKRAVAIRQCVVLIRDQFTGAALDHIVEALLCDRFSRNGLAAGCRGAAAAVERREIARDGRLSASGEGLRDGATDGVAAAACLAAIPLSGQLHLALGAIPLALGYAWARTPRATWWKAGLGAATALAAGLVVDHSAVAGSIGTGRSFAQVDRYSAELSDFVTRGVGSGIEELVFVGWLTPLVALAGLASIRERRGLAVLLGAAALAPCLLALGANLPGYETLWRTVPGLDATRVPERFMPIACLALAALVAFAVNALVTQCHERLSPAAVAWVTALALAIVAVDLHVPVFGAVAADTPNAAYAAIRGRGRLLELPVFRPDVHYGSVYLGYARQSPRERPQGYSTIAPKRAVGLARELRPLSCGRGTVPGGLGIRFVAVHRGLYAQSGFFAPGCADRAEAMLRSSGWHLLARQGPIAAYRR
jgi:hypothetical protein